MFVFNIAHLEKSVQLLNYNLVSGYIVNISHIVTNYWISLQETLQQLIVMSLPNVLIIGKNPFSGKF